MIAGGGGFLFETVRLAEILRERYELVYLTSCSKPVIEPKLPEKSVIYFIPFMYSRKIVHKKDKIQRFLVTLLRSFKIIRKEKPDYVVWVGDALGLPMAICGKFFGKKIVFIESLARINNPSKTGKILENFRIADRIYVQWPELLPHYNKAVYKGSLI